MTRSEVEGIVQRGAFPEGCISSRLVETHISWVILTPKFAFKLKKPVRFDFLDFSTLALRRKYCKEELALNRRLAPDTYLDVMSVGFQHGQLQIGGNLETVVDFAVWMRRENDGLQLDRLLQQNKVMPQDLIQLAHQLAAFHRQYALRRPHFEPTELEAQFADLFRHEKALIAAVDDDSAANYLSQMRHSMPIFIKRHAARLVERARMGFWVDGHGDLHSHNIILTQPPVVFDCIEFDPLLRRLDVLNELAFLCMDFDFHGRPDLSAAFLDFYKAKHPCMELPEDEQLFVFFKAYRANVRLKVDLMAQPVRQESVRAYWKLLRKYWQVIMG